jgi:hypothetical protein
MALLTWAGAWTMITVILWLLGPATAAWPLPLRTLVISVLMVLALTWVVIPSLTHLFAGWLAQPPRTKRSSRSANPGAAAAKCPAPGAISRSPSRAAARASQMRSIPGV